MMKTSADREREYIVEGSTNSDDLNDRLDLDLTSEEYDSVGGFIIEHIWTVFPRS